MIQEHKDRAERLEWVRDNKSKLLWQKKSAIKYADPVAMCDSGTHGLGAVTKALKQDVSEHDEFRAKLVINTTNLLDSHGDVHIPGLWGKSLKEKRDLYLINSHKLSFEDIISDDIKAAAEKLSWRSIGYKFEGETEALVFHARISKERNPYMAEQYAKGRIKQHSVSMQYVKIFLCIDSDDKYDAEERANWNKYFPFVANAKEAIDTGFFWAVTEAKVIEGSAVVLGSNYATPVISFEPSSDTQKQQEEPAKPLDLMSLNKAIKEIRINNF